MPSQELTISNKLGIHARPAAQFVKTASRFEAHIRVEKDGEEVDGKSSRFDIEMDPTGNAERHLLEVDRLRIGTKIDSKNEIK